MNGVGPTNQPSYSYDDGIAVLPVTSPQTALGMMIRMPGMNPNAGDVGLTGTGEDDDGI